MARGSTPAAGSGMNMGGGMSSSPAVPTVTPGAPAEIPTAQPNLAAFPVTIQNCGRTLTFARPPERAVPLYPLAAEPLLRLGLKDRIAAVAFTEGDPVAPDLRAAYNALPALSTDSPPNKEVLLTARPDFVIDNFPGFFYNAANGLATVEELQANGAQVYTLTARCEGNEANGKVEDLYTDITNLGKIFGVSAHTEQLVAQMKSRVKLVQDKIAGKPRPRVLIYDSGIGPINVYGPGAISDVVAQAGGQNVFADQGREFLMLSAEEVAARDPEIFLVSQREARRGMSMGKDLTAQEAADFLIKTFPNTTAAKNKRVVIVPYQQLYASLQNIDGIEALAKAFYPEVFK
jgi:iron complex transport system substrate-binding protein